ncbi:MAG: hypothetical protein ACREJO_01825 [Phycisphaerales bacterium]
MSPESFNAALALRKLEAADILLIQAKRGSDADRIRAASAILRMAFMAEPKPQKAAVEPPVSKGAPARPQQSEDMPGDPPYAPVPPPRQSPPPARLPPIIPSTHTTVARTLVNSS